VDQAEKDLEGKDAAKRVAVAKATAAASARLQASREAIAKMRAQHPPTPPPTAPTPKPTSGPTTRLTMAPHQQDPQALESMSKAQAKAAAAPKSNRRLRAASQSPSSQPSLAHEGAQLAAAGKKLDQYADLLAADAVLDAQRGGGDDDYDPFRSVGPTPLPEAFKRTVEKAEHWERGHCDLELDRNLSHSVSSCCAFYENDTCQVSCTDCYLHMLKQHCFQRNLKAEKVYEHLSSMATWVHSCR
jgi:hypothetical protein